ncbi:MAG: hypothetical protein B6D56_06540 [Candidatus Omnitrophica bacterium 4484_70.1]|nr:MAG: hypothetical protein B6D56_06540 [Candidatus Omnitrophica bacterium 4484_70.1]
MKIELSILVGILFSLELIFVIVDLLKERKKMFYFLPKDVNIWRCEVCSHVYFVWQNTIFSRCPLCSSINKRR